MVGIQVGVGNKWVQTVGPLPHVGHPVVVAVLASARNGASDRDGVGAHLVGLGVVGDQAKEIRPQDQRETSGSVRAGAAASW